MTQKENELLEKLIKDLSEFNKDHMEMMTRLNTPEEFIRWKKNRKLFNVVQEDFDNFLLVRAGKEPIF